MGKSYGFWVIIISLMIAMLVDSFSLPQEINLFRPNIILLVLVYWIVALPHRVGIFTGWIVGLLVDALYGTPFGLYGFTYAIITGIALLIYNQFRLFPAYMQSITIFLLMMIFLALSLWIQSFIKEASVDWLYWFSALSSAILWPWIYKILRDTRQRFHVQ